MSRGRALSSGKVVKRGSQYVPLQRWAEEILTQLAALAELIGDPQLRSVVAAQHEFQYVLFPW